MKQYPCPSCGAPVPFRSEQTLYATCASCQTLLIRKDVNVEAIGKVAALQPDGTLLRVGTRGVYQGKSFEIFGRIQIRLGKGEDTGFWNEWYAGFSDGRGGWVGEAMGEYFVNFESDEDLELPPWEQLGPGDLLEVEGMQLVVTDTAVGRVVSFEGELPDIAPREYELHYADLKSVGGAAATIDYSDPKQPSLFLGKWCTFDQLKLSGLRVDDVDSAARGSGAAVKSMTCPGCGAPLSIKAVGVSKSLVCPYCDRQMDLTADANVGKIVQLNQQKNKVPARVPLGSKGSFRIEPGLEKVSWECIGYMRRSTVADGETYRWSEYLLYEAQHGYRWLTDSDGQWTFLRPLFRLPSVGGLPVGSPPAHEVRLDETTYKHFQTCQATVTYVAGEFFWRVRLGDRSTTVDYVAPPLQISAETGPTEINWSSGAHLEAAEVFRAFGLKDSAASPGPGAGVFGLAAPASRVVPSPNAPNPYSERVSRWWLGYSSYATVGLMLMMFCVFRSSVPVWSQDFTYDQSAAELSQIAPMNLTSGPSNLELEVSAPLNNRWMYFQLSVIDTATNTALDSGTQISYYSWSDEDGFSSEGSNHNTVMFPHIGPGSYLLRVEPQTGEGDVAEPIGKTPVRGAPTRINYTVKAYQGVALWWNFLLSLGVLLIPPAWLSYQSSQFETRRWSASDHAPEES